MRSTPTTPISFPEALRSADPEAGRATVEMPALVRGSHPHQVRRRRSEADTVPVTGSARALQPAVIVDDELAFEAEAIVAAAPVAASAARPVPGSPGWTMSMTPTPDAPFPASWATEPGVALAVRGSTALAPAVARAPIAPLAVDVDASLPGDVGLSDDRTAMVGGRYELVRRLPGVINTFVARDVRIQRDVVVKLARRGHHDRFAAEATAIAAVHSRYLAEIYDCGVDDRFAYLVYERPVGRSLGEVVAAGPLAPAAALRLIVQLLDGLGALHRHGVIHGGVMPAQVRVGTNDAVQLCGLTVPPAAAAAPPIAGSEAPAAAVAHDLATAMRLFTSLVRGRGPTDGDPTAALPPAYAALVQRALAAELVGAEASAAGLRRALIAVETPAAAAPPAVPMRPGHRTHHTRVEMPTLRRPMPARTVRRIGAAVAVAAVVGMVLLWLFLPAMTRVRQAAASRFGGADGAGAPASHESGRVVRPSIETARLASP